MKTRSIKPILLILLALGAVAFQQVRFRRPIRVPDIPGYLTLKCDFHTHTVFSDGSVWPDIRSEEAWREGLDAIAITDHIEYLPHKEDLPPSHDRSFEIAKPHGDQLDVIVIRGSEVTRDMPPGHLNAVFLKSSTPLDTEDWRDALRIARQQGAFIFWNHPGWEGQQPDGKARWYPEHSELVEKDQLHGIEVLNGRMYYPEAHQWCLEKDLAILSNSDIHYPLNLDYFVHQGDPRPVTLVFARERTAESIKEAVMAGRTAALGHGMVIGREEHLRPLFDRSIRVSNPSLTLEGRKTALLRIHNDSDVTYQLSGSNRFEEASVPERIELLSGRTVLVPVRGLSKTLSGSRRLRLSYSVDNAKIAPDQGLPVVFDIEVQLVPAE